MIKRINRYINEVTMEFIDLIKEIPKVPKEVEKNIDNALDRLEEFATNGKKKGE